MSRRGNLLEPNFGPPGYRFAFRKNIVLNDNIDKKSENLQRYIMGKRTVEYLK